MDGKLVRVLDFIFSFCGLLLLLPVILVLTVLGVLDTGSPIFVQKRVGMQKKPFKLIKFRTMSLETESVATHLVSSSSVTRYGAFLRKTKLDELPQLINVLRGEMSFVGPRPCLVSQSELIKERDERGVNSVRPGITGLAQIQGIDMSTPALLATTDAQMMKSFSLTNYFKYIIKTALGQGGGDKVRS